MCGILLHLTASHPTPTPSFLALPWPLGAMLAGHTTGTLGRCWVQRGCRRDAEASRLPPPPPPAQGCHINRFSGRAPRCGCSILARCDVSPPEPLALPWPHVPADALSSPLLSSPPPPGSARQCPQVHFASPGVAGLQPATGTAEQIPAMQRHSVVIPRQPHEQL